MKFVQFTSIILLISLIFSSHADEDISKSVINGEDASIEDHPYMAHVFTLFMSTCGGSILNTRNVLTVKLIF
jgi:secreted trypsin-like serine protease